MKTPEIVIVGGGPAGMVLAYQLVTSGLPVRVLERHPDFHREFRGELFQPSVLEYLERAGILSLLLERGLALPDIERRMYLPELKRKLLAALPEALQPHVERQLDENTESQVLKIIVDRVRRWHAPGVLFLGDAAHTMSPSGGQGLNLAIRDTFVAANHLVEAIQAGRALDESLFQAIQDERQREIDAIQAGQTRAGQMVLKPLGVLHVMFTILGVVMRLAGKRMQLARGVRAVDPRHLTPVKRASA